MVTNRNTAIRLTAILALLSLSPTLMAMEKQYLNFWEIAECPSEAIEVLGTVRFQYQETGKGWVLQAFWTGDAWGVDTGDEYRIQGKWFEVVQEKRPFVMYWNDHFQLIGKGTAPNYRFYGRVKFVVDENGDWVPEVVGMEWQCPTIAYDEWE